MNPPSLLHLYQELLPWFLREKRDLPWRHTQDPYAIWISEVMLQQTRVEAVKPYYLHFLSTFPDLQKLAKAPEAEVLKQWEGLGYYSRAKNLQRGARFVLEKFHGILPANFDELLTIPGIGPYTAGAIASFAYHLPHAAVDGNVLRVLSRVFALPLDPSRQKDRNQLANRIEKELFHPKTPEKVEVHVWNEGLIELGALVCTPKSPQCEVCPWKKDCQARAQDRILDFPLKKKKKESPEQAYAALLLRDEFGRYLVHRRPEEGLLSGMWEFPLLEGDFSVAGLEAYFEDQISFQYAGKKKHVFSHVVWLIDFFRGEVKASHAMLHRVAENSHYDEDENWKWCSDDELRKLPFGSAFHAWRERLLLEEEG